MIDLKNKIVLVTAGPTYEALDPVRFIGNRSTGKQGYAIVENLLDRGAQVILVSGPTNLKIERGNLTVIHVESALEMLEAVKHNWCIADIGIFAAAVADYRPMNVADQKIKKNDDTLTIELVKNPDILLWAGSVKSDKQILVGFALETVNGVEYAKEKLKKKNLDFIVLNTLEDEGAGFGHDTNKISIITPTTVFETPVLKSKITIAENIVSYIELMYEN